MGRMCDDVRRRISHQLHGRRGRASDVEYQLKNALRYGPGRLSDRGRREILDGLGELVVIDGDAAYDLRVSWTAKNLLLRVLALSPSRTGRPITRTEIAHALFRFFDHVAIFGTGIPELVTATETIDNWLEEITNAVYRGITNAAAEGVNRLTKLIYRVAFGMSNVANQQLRARYIASRATRPRWRPTVTAYATAT